MSNRRKRTGLLVTVLIASLAAPSLALAQRRGGSRSDGPQHPLGRVLWQLDLSSEQRAQIQGILLANREGRQQQARQMREARQALRQAVRAPQADEAAIRGAAATVAQMESERAVARAETLGQVREKLTPEQRERFNELLARQPDRAGRRGGSPRRGPGRGFGPGAGDL